MVRMIQQRQTDKGNSSSASLVNTIKGSTDNKTQVKLIKNKSDKLCL